MRLSRRAGKGKISIHASCGIERCSAVGIRVDGTAFSRRTVDPSNGADKEAIVVLGSSQLKKQGRERMVEFVSRARKTLKVKLTACGASSVKTRQQ